MFSACFFEHTLRNNTQVFLKLKDSFLRFVYISSTRPSLLTSSMLSRGAVASKEIPPHQQWGIITRNIDHFLISVSSLSCSIKSLFNFIYQIQHGLQHFHLFGGFRCILRGATLERAKPITKQSPKYFEFDGAIRGLLNRAAHSFLDCIPRITNRNSQWWLQRTENAIRIRTAAPNHSTDLEWSEPAAQSIQILATMAVVNHEHDKIYSPQLPEPWELSPKSTLPMNVSIFDSRETTPTTTGDNTFNCSDEPRWSFFLPSSPS